MHRSSLLPIPLPALRLCLLLAALCGRPEARAEADHNGPPCLAPDGYFQDEVWTKVGARFCLECHKPGGDAEDSKFLLQDPSRDPAPSGAARPCTTAPRSRAWRRSGKTANRASC